MNGAMHVVKWPRIRLRKKYVLLEFRQKCPKCKTIVEIDDLNDLDYDGLFSLEGGWGIFNKLDHRYKWDYECPYCNRKQSLSDKNLDYLTRFIDINNVDLYPYEEMDRIKFHDVFHATPYYKYYGYWLGAKYNVTVHSSLKDDNVEAAFKEDPEMVDRLTNTDGKFISENEFEKLFGNSSDTEKVTNALKEHIEKQTEEYKDTVQFEKDSEEYKNTVQSLMREERCTRFRKVGYATDANGRLNLCIDTNGPYCVLLVLSGDGCVTDQSLIPTANFRFYERVADTSFCFENTRYRYW